MRDAVFSMIDAEFDGKSWNGPSFMATLEKLSWQEASDKKTWEGYSAWEIALHCAKCKVTIARDLGKTISGWTYPDEGWFPAPKTASAEAWQSDKALLADIHRTCMEALRGMTDADLEKPMPSWKAPWKDVIAWLLTHDAFHGAQIRSMGLPSLREPAKN